MSRNLISNFYKFWILNCKKLKVLEPGIIKNNRLTDLKKMMVQQIKTQCTLCNGLYLSLLGFPKHFLTRRRPR